MLLVSAYLFEHLFYAHLRLTSAPNEWFRSIAFSSRP